MSNGGGFRPHIIEARRRLAEGRAKLKQRHQQGSPGIQVCAGVADLLDSVVLFLYQTALEETAPENAKIVHSQIALVAHGGFGRRDVAPYSDVDLMILIAPRSSRAVGPVATRVLRDLYDVGLDVGPSVRTPRQACRLSRGDAKICTSLMESRFLDGSEQLYERFHRSFQRFCRRRRRAVFAALERARLEERAKYGETIYMLEPNVKRSRGGLRDIHLLRWIGFACYGTNEPDGLQLRGVLSRADNRVVHRAAEFLLRLRNEMHFSAGKSNDVLNRSEQVRIAKAHGFDGDQALLPVERFMQEYFRRTKALAGVVSRVAAGAQSSNPLAEGLSRLVAHQMEGDFRVGPQQITATKKGLAKLEGNLGEVLRLADLANLYDKRIAHATCEEIRPMVTKLSDRLSPAAVRHFLSLLRHPSRLGEILRTLHDLGVLEKVIPAIGRTRCLLQFNNYHQYTVDEHCLLAVERATRLMNQQTHLSSVYQSVGKKHVLHLALLIHDLGKGLAEDHSEVGVHIARDIAERLGLSTDDSDALTFLVHKHLLMSHLAFRRDTSDEKLVVRFAVECGSPEVLRMLYVMTASDFAAVGPGVWTEWKADVLAELFDRAMQHLTGHAAPIDSEAWIEARRGELREQLVESDKRDWLSGQIDALPSSYMVTDSAEGIVAELGSLAALRSGEVTAEGRYFADRQAVRYQVGTYEAITPGVFHRLTGALASQGLEVLSAEIYTLAEGLVLDRFFVLDQDCAGEPPESRLRSVERALVEALVSPSEVAPSFSRRWRVGERSRREPIAALPTDVKIDNTNSDRFTVIDVFAADRPGLLYTISKTLFALGLSVSLAKIATHLDQVVDVFYVVDKQGGKIESAVRLDEIRRELITRIEALAREEARTTDSW